MPSLRRVHEDDLIRDYIKHVVKDVWYVKFNEAKILENAWVLKRAGMVRDLLRRISTLKLETKPFNQQLILGNYVGAMQRFLLGDDTLSIHLSSYSMEDAFLYKIGRPTEEEQRKKGKRPHWTFSDITSLIHNRGLLKNPEADRLTDRIITRRNMFVHDAITQEVLRAAKIEFMDKPLQSSSKRNELVLHAIQPLLKRVGAIDNVPVVTWYLHPESLRKARELVMEFLKSSIGDFDKTGVDPQLDLLKALSMLRLAVENARSGELNYLPYAARDNLQEVFIVLEDLYEGALFRGPV